MNLLSEDSNLPLLLEVINTKQCIYTPNYCEENVWHLAKQIQLHSENAFNNCYVIFVSNDKTLVPLWKQKASTKEDGFVLWDYHVFLVYEGQSDSLVYDLDSQLPFPSKFNDYCRETFRTDNNIKPEFHRFFRVVEGCDFLKNFASDRHHMRNEDGSWIKPPPVYSPISTANNVHNLSEYISMIGENDKASHYGIIFNLSNFYVRFLKPCEIPNQLKENISEMI